MKKIVLSIAFATTCLFTIAQEVESERESVESKSLDSILITGYFRQSTILRLPPTQGTYVYSGKKTEVLNLLQTNANFADKTGRQVFAKVPGVFVYDMDGAGNQVNIATRGLDPHRGWEFNIRKDGIVTNSDMYGYPASHYSMPLESIDHIELVRGTGALQYGAQFGGMLNYVSKKADSARKFSFESINTAGSFNLLSTYNAVGGKVGKFRYYAYFYKKSRDGYRDVEHTNSEAENITIAYEPSKNFSLKIEWARSTYTYRIPGQLNDSMFKADPKQATRTRNYFNPDIHIPSVVLNWNITPTTKLQFTSSAVLGRRNSVMFDKATNIRDTINTTTMQYNNRQVDIDGFNSYTNELRVLQNYFTGRNMHTLTTGIQYMHNNLHRTQLGKGTTGSDFDLTLVEPGWGRDMHFKTKNIAIFAENNFQLLRNLSINAGARVEMGRTDMTGKVVYYPDENFPVSIKHQYPLFGAGFTYNVTGNMDVYGGFSQAYRSMTFKDLIPASVYEKVDPNIKDAKGYNAEIGFRGTQSFLKWDITAYVLQYKNRFGTLSETDATGEFYTYRTNIGKSFTKGLELFIQGDWQTGNRSVFSVFTSTAFMHARYKNATVKRGNANVNVDGNKVESAPDLTTRNGITFRYHKLSMSVLYSYVSETYADALNTKTPNAIGSLGVVPAYSILDFNSTFHISPNFEIRVNINNLANKKYFTKRPTFYPGPGIWPSEGRSFNAVFSFRL
ncbi:MAG: TonB-dependent receptor [Chitinophagaceae bacterium]|nr:TonB-dependent receptor [Chitinophagaceae bacterium]